MQIRPINSTCPQCGNKFDVIPHETHIQRLQECVERCVGNQSFIDMGLSIELRTQLGQKLFEEINDFLISEDIARQKMKTTQKIAQYRREEKKQ